MKKTDEFSFQLKPSTIEGVGVFAVHDIAPDAWLAIKPPQKIGRTLRKEEIPAQLLGYCILQGDGTYNCPPEFNHMHLVWYLNHSHTPNAELRDDGDYSTRTIQGGEEILIDYGLFDEAGVEGQPDYLSDPSAI